MKNFKGKLISNNDIIHFLKVSLSLALFIFLAISLRGGSQFYESGIYIDYAKSIIQDFDLNIINQVHQEMTWLITSSHYHPDFHPETQTPFLLGFYLIEKLSSYLTGFSFHNPEQFILAALALNFFIIYFTAIWSKVLIKDYFRIKSPWPIVFIIIGSTFAYFSFFTTTVTDAFSAPLLIFLLIHFKRLLNIPSKKFLVLFGLALGVFGQLKVIYIPLTLYFFFKLIYSYFRSKQYSFLPYLLTSAAVPLLLNSLNKFIKFGSLFMEPNAGAKVLFDYSLEHVWSKLATGFFGQGGFFFLNPALLLGIFCFFLMIFKTIKKKVLTKEEGIVFTIFLGIVFLHPIFMLGPFIEDMLPGRATLASLPFLLLGISYVYNDSKRPLFWKTIFLAIIIWNIFIILNYVIIDSNDAELYYSQKIATEYLKTNFIIHMRESRELLSFAYPTIILFSIIIGAISISIKKFSSLNFRHYVILTFWVVIFTGITITNVTQGPRNVEKMKKDGYFKDKVIGDGSDIFLFDYLLDRFNAINRSTNGNLIKELDKRANQYFINIKPQIIRSSSEFDKILIEKKWNETFMERMKSKEDKR